MSERAEIDKLRRLQKLYPSKAVDRLIALAEESERAAQAGRPPAPQVSVVIEFRRDGTVEAVLVPVRCGW